MSWAFGSREVTPSLRERRKGQEIRGREERGSLTEYEECEFRSRDFSPWPYSSFREEGDECKEEGEDGDSRGGGANSPLRDRHQSLEADGHQGSPFLLRDMHVPCRRDVVGMIEGDLKLETSFLVCSCSLNWQTARLLHCELNGGSLRGKRAKTLAPNGT